MSKKNRTKKSKEEAEAYLKAFLDKYAQNEHIVKMQAFPHHPPISAYAHSLRVVAKCVDVANRFHSSVDWDNLLMAALLHDFYLYDFKDKSTFFNGLNHALIAANNAKEIFDVNDHVYRCIRTHMFPIAPWRFPSSREAWILTIADKMVASGEVFAKKDKTKKEKKKK